MKNSKFSNSKSVSILKVAYLATFVGLTVSHHHQTGNCLIKSELLQMIQY